MISPLKIGGGSEIGVFLYFFPFFFWGGGGFLITLQKALCRGTPVNFFFFEKGADPASDSLKNKENRIQGGPMSIFFFLITLNAKSNCCCLKV